MPGPTKQISIRLPIELYDELESRGKSLDLSPGLYARTVIEEALDTTAENESDDGIRALRYLMQQTRNDLATVAKALLIHAGGISVEDVDRWIQKEL